MRFGRVASNLQKQHAELGAIPQGFPQTFYFIGQIYESCFVLGSYQAFQSSAAGFGSALS
jgi:hypothetical protein